MGKMYAEIYSLFNKERQDFEILSNTKQSQVLSQSELICFPAGSI